MVKYDPWASNGPNHLGFGVQWSVLSTPRALTRQGSGGTSRKEASWQLTGLVAELRGHGHVRRALQMQTTALSGAKGKTAVLIVRAGVGEVGVGEEGEDGEEEGMDVDVD